MSVVLWVVVVVVEVQWVCWSESGPIALCPAVIIQSNQQLVRQLSRRPADKRFCLPEADGSDQFLRLPLTARQSRKLKAPTTFRQNSPI